MFFNQLNQITRESQELINSCIDGDINLVKSWINSGADINATDPQYGDTALSQAALKGHKDIVIFLLSLQKSTQYSKYLALIFSSQARHVEIMKMFVADGANVNASHFKDYP